MQSNKKVNNIIEVFKYIMRIVQFIYMYIYIELCKDEEKTF